MVVLRPLFLISETRPNQARTALERRKSKQKQYWRKEFTMGELITYMIPVFGVLALLYTFWKSSWVERQDAGTDKMKKIAEAIATGAMAFLKAEYKVLAIFVLAVAILLGISGTIEGSSPLIAFSFITGALCSSLAGFLGMRVATKANVRTTNAARTSLVRHLRLRLQVGP
jgi:K(+)-stimulated pyrophosphate-energized sodium pump